MPGARQAPTAFEMKMAGAAVWVGSAADLNEHLYVPRKIYENKLCSIVIMNPAMDATFRLSQACMVMDTASSVDPSTDDGSSCRVRISGGGA
jgi:hypothetical protein